ncbi:MAG: phosphoribosylformylglycinamidine synthase subunit PurS [Leptospiraceae bacterium]|nr:phosphoribosylformylglycinamidine synthase subunit PurS [Leptospiraceae bacterium]MDW8306605.1 phosphoribosylformylglycinamidine synthase subunit PurS [Leptospiraceae bacterium]
MPYKANVVVRYKKSVLEPQGQAILLSLREQGDESFLDVRVGKYIEILLEAENLQAAEEKVRKLAEDLLHNPVMENCSITVSQDD